MALDEQPKIPGVNIFGYLLAESGVGEHARQLVNAVRRAEVDFAAIPYTRTLSRQRHPFEDHGTGIADYPVSIVAINADEFPAFVADVGNDFLRSRYTVGLWAWEIEDFPASMGESQQFVDEVWANSSFSAEAIRNRIDKPVYPFPLPVLVPPHKMLPRSELGLLDGFLFLFCFDFDSVFRRKNPLAVVEAFSIAFGADHDVRLVIKCVNGDKHATQMAELKAATERHPGISIVDGYWDFSRQQALMSSCDAYVSLHRSEGFGLTIAEAMAYAKPVIATAYSGNLDFMTEDNSYLVPAGRIRIGDGCEPYPHYALWAEPDLEAAAEIMRTVVSDPSSASRKAAQARRDIEQFHSPIARSEFIAERMKAISSHVSTRPMNHHLPSSFYTKQSETLSSTANGGTFVSGPGTTEVDVIAAIETRLQAGPDLISPTGLGKLGLCFRRFVYRILRNYELYQTELVRTTILALRDLEQRLDQINQRVEDLESRLEGSDDRMKQPK